MQKKHSGFTLFEMLLSLTIMATIVAMVAPNLKNNLLDSDKIKVQRVYSQLITVVDAMLRNTVVYPDASGFANTDVVQDPTTKEWFGGQAKFADMFKAQLNILEPKLEKLEAIAATSTIKMGCASITADPCLAASVRPGVTCFSTNDGTTYCLPANTMDIFNVSDSDRVAVIKVFFKDNFENVEQFDKAGFYFGITADGRVNPMSVGSTVGASGATIATDCYDEDKEKQHEEYSTVAQCRLDTYLSDR